MNNPRQNPSPRVSFFPNDELESDIRNMPLHILVAEDDWATRDLLVRTLSTEPFYTITVVENGTRAWEVLEDQEDPPRLALLDWMMPGLDGIELCNRLVERKGPFVYTIILTARAQNDDVIKGLEAGAHEYLTKPFDLRVLRSRVAAGERIVKLEMLLKMKNEIIQDYAEKLENLIEQRAEELMKMRRASAPEVKPDDGSVIS